MYISTSAATGENIDLSISLLTKGINIFKKRDA